MIPCDFTLFQDMMGWAGLLFFLCFTHICWGNHSSYRQLVYLLWELLFVKITFSLSSCCSLLGFDLVNRAQKRTYPVLELLVLCAQVVSLLIDRGCCVWSCRCRSPLRLLECCGDSRAQTGSDGEQLLVDELLDFANGVAMHWVLCYNTERFKTG